MNEDRSDVKNCVLGDGEYCPYFTWPGEDVVCLRDGHLVNYRMGGGRIKEILAELYTNCPLPDPRVICKL